MLKADLLQYINEIANDLTDKEEFISSVGLYIRLYIRINKKTSIGKF